MAECAWINPDCFGKIFLAYTQRTSSVYQSIAECIPEFPRCVAQELDDLGNKVEERLGPVVLPVVYSIFTYANYLSHFGL